MNREFLKLLTMLALTACLTSCGFDDVEEENIEPTATQTFGIRHDKTLSDYEGVVENATDSDPNFESVIFFNYSLDGSNNQEFSASGTLIADNWILTAGHNFFVAAEQSSPATPGGIEIRVGNDPNNPSQTYKVEKLIFHPTWLTENEDYIKANDLCLVKLSTPVTSLTPVELFTTSTESIGDKVWFCGYGDYSRLQGQNPDLLSKKHAVENILDRKNNGIITSINGVNYNGGLLAIDFDNPEGTINSLGDNIINQDEDLLGAGSSSSASLDLEGTTVQGDSGGPLFVKDGDVWKLAGVLSGGASEPITNHIDGSYGDISIFIRVSQHIDWIQSVIQ